MNNFINIMYSFFITIVFCVIIFTSSIKSLEYDLYFIFGVFIFFISYFYFINFINKYFNSKYTNNK